MFPVGRVIVGCVEFSLRTRCDYFGLSIILASSCVFQFFLLHFCTRFVVVVCPTGGLCLVVKTVLILVRGRHLAIGETVLPFYLSFLTRGVLLCPFDERPSPSSYGVFRLYPEVWAVSFYYCLRVRRCGHVRLAFLHSAECLPVVSLWVSFARLFLNTPPSWLPFFSCAKIPECPSPPCFDCLDQLTLSRRRPLPLRPLLGSEVSPSSSRTRRPPLLSRSFPPISRDDRHVESVSPSQRGRISLHASD